ncbi:hypothetical protein ACFX2J_017705 [Malus domestica]
MTTHLPESHSLSFASPSTSSSASTANPSSPFAPSSSIEFSTGTLRFPTSISPVVHASTTHYSPHSLLPGSPRAVQSISRALDTPVGTPVLSHIGQRAQVKVL